MPAGRAARPPHRLTHIVEAPLVPRWRRPFPPVSAYTGRAAVSRRRDRSGSVRRRHPAGARRARSPTSVKPSAMTHASSSRSTRNRVSSCADPWPQASDRSNVSRAARTVTFGLHQAAKIDRLRGHGVTDGDEGRARQPPRSRRRRRAPRSRAVTPTGSSSSDRSPDHLGRASDLHPLPSDGVEFARE